MLEKQTLLQFNDLTVKYAEQLILDSLHGSILKGSKIGLIGINGSGKSTLLKCLAGILKANTGNVITNASIEYVQQLDLKAYRGTEFLYNYVEKYYEEWWRAFSMYELTFKDTLEENRILKILSGGELVRLNIAIALSKKPDILLLDEPTNHLDLQSLTRLIQFLKKTTLSFIAVSHNIDFLNSVVSTIWELKDKHLTVFGGNYDFYKQKKKEELETQKRKYEVARKEYKKRKRSIEREQKRVARSKAVTKKYITGGDRGTDRFAKYYFRDRSQVVAGKNKIMLESKLAKAMENMKKAKVASRKNVYLELNYKRRKGLVLSILDADLILPNSKPLINNINISIYHGDRIAILGNNGSGKTTLIQQLQYKKQKYLFGDVKYGKAYSTLYVDQKYDLVNPYKTILENLHTSNESLTYENARRVLSNLGFAFEDNTSVLASTLSGGETARLAFAMATTSNIDMLVLDEPTNNLDIETIEAIANALKMFKGTLIVVSHDIHFLKQINIKSIYTIKDKCLYHDKLMN